jgi:excisionase family DNA binding protein
MLQKPDPYRASDVPRRAHPVKEACRALGISPSTMYRHAHAGKIKLIYIGGRTLVPEAEVARLSSEGTE